MTHRYVCDVLAEMRTTTETLNFAVLLSLIEECQTMVNRMEAKLWEMKDIEDLHQEIKDLKKKKKEFENDLKKQEEENKKKTETPPSIWGNALKSEEEKENSTKKTTTD